MKHFIDLFAGCGGLSLGLLNAGWTGVFAIERSPDAFETLKHNLVATSRNKKYAWPEWLPCEAMTTGHLIQNYSSQLKRLRGKIDLIAGGPPCQGFSFAGRRNPSDPRNRLTEEYIEIVKLVQPRFLLLENVKGFNAAFKTEINDENLVYADVVKLTLEKIGYEVHSKMLNASMFGVPQPRPRFIMIAVKKSMNIKDILPFSILEKSLRTYRKEKGLPILKDTSVRNAISDLEVSRTKLIPCDDTAGFYQISYIAKNLTSYQKLMRTGLPRSSAPNSLRLPSHRAETLQRFRYILKHCAKGKSVSTDQLQSLGTRKQCFTPLHPDLPSKTVTTLPDDLLHYSEPRILTVRENARIQSFPDWFEFRGKYTTGGNRRKEECPRYSQVGNAVPPLMAEALGITLSTLNRSQKRASK